MEDLTNVDPDFLYTNPEEKTFQFQDDLPSLPVPPLQQTLDKYLASVKPHLTDDEYRQTEFIVKQFGSGIGKELHKKLLDRASNHRNWLEKWWEDYAYLELRYPIAPFINFAGYAPYVRHCYPPREGEQIERASMILYFTMKYWEIIRKEKMRVDKDNKGNRLCMNQFYRAFSTCRIPGIKKDKLLYYFQSESEGPTPTHIVVFCNGRMFWFDIIDEKDEPLTPLEIKKQLQWIHTECDNNPPGPGIGALTGHERTTWAELRSRLAALHPENYQNLECIQKAIVGVSLDNDCPVDSSDVFQCSLAGNPTDRWFDKSAVSLFYKNGYVSSTCDHAPLDAMVAVSSTFYIDLSLKNCKGCWEHSPVDGMVVASQIYYIDCKLQYSKGKWQGTTVIRDLPKPKELKFHIDDVILEGIQTAKKMFLAVGANLQCYTQMYQNYGKKFLRQHKLHPDTHVQLALQYAYYKKYKRPGPCYETATTRKFYHGRTETMRPCTVEAINWSKAMLETNIAMETKKTLYLKAANMHNKLMAEAQQNQGVDRHLMGLSIIAAEEGLPTPLLYQDKAYTKSGGGGNFILSTSMVGYTTVFGGVVPMMENGYGVFYHIEANTIEVVVTAWKSGEDTDAKEFLELIYSCLDDMKSVIESQKSVAAKL